MSRKNVSNDDFKIGQFIVCQLFDLSVTLYALEIQKKNKWSISYIINKTLSLYQGFPINCIVNLRVGSIVKFEGTEILIFSW